MIFMGSINGIGIFEGNFGDSGYMNGIWMELNDVIDGILPFFGVMKPGGALRS